jgi:periplasmic copper chaperone A
MTAMMTIRSLTIAAAFVLASPAMAQQFTAGDISVEKAWAPATPKGAPVGAGYLVIHNKGTAPDKLMGGASDAAADVQVHEMSMKNGVMSMRQLSDGLTVPANGSVTLAPRGDHLMFQGLKQPFVKGQTVKAMLNFEHAGSLPIELKVESVGAQGPGGAKAPAADSMKGMKMD